MSNRTFHLLAPAGQALIAAYEGTGDFVFKAPALAGEVGSPSMRAFKLHFAVSKGSSISDATDYLKLDSSPDGGATWFYIPEDGNSSDAFNFLSGKSGTSVAFQTVVWLFPGEWVRLRANAGITLDKVGIQY